MIVCGVAEHEVGIDAQVPFMGFPEKFLKILHGPEFRIDFPVIRDGIAAITLLAFGSNKQRRYPDGIIHIQAFYIVELLRDPLEIAMTIAVGVMERGGVNLINNL